MMQFIVSGYIPGTDIQITYYMIANTIAIATVAYLVYLLLKEEKYIQKQKYIASVKISKIIKQITL